MKIILIALLIMPLIDNQPNHTQKKLITFQPIGVFTSEMRPMLISTKTLNFPLSGMDIYRLKLGKVDINTLSKEKIDEITSIEYVKVVTDRLTFSTIREFIFRQSQYYVNGRSLINKPSKNSFVIIYGGLRDTVDSKLAHKFIVELQKCLMLNFNDPLAANKIANFKYDSHPD